MDAKKSAPNILVLSGVSLDDYKSLDDKYAEEMMERMVGDEISVSQYNVCSDKIPTTFCSLDEWPTETTARCHNCTLGFNNRPVPIPTIIRELPDGRVEFNVRGNMCSFPCVRRWIDVHYHDLNVRDNIMRNLSLLYFIFTGRQKTDIQSAPEHTLLKCYGGDMTEEQYKKRIAAIDHIARSSDDPVPEEQRIPTIVRMLRGTDRDLVRKYDPQHVTSIISPGLTDNDITVGGNTMWSFAFQYDDDDADADAELLRLVEETARASTYVEPEPTPAPAPEPAPIPEPVAKVVVKKTVAKRTKKSIAPI